MPTYVNGELVPDGTPFRLIDLIHHHQLGDLYFAKLPRYSEKIYYAWWHEDYWYKTDSLAKLFRVARNYVEEVK